MDTRIELSISDAEDDELFSGASIRPTSPFTHSNASSPRLANASPIGSRPLSAGNVRKRLPARSHVVRRSDDVSPNTGLSVSISAEQQTLSWTYRQLALASEDEASTTPFYEPPRLGIVLTSPQLTSTRSVSLLTKQVESDGSDTATPRPAPKALYPPNPQEWALSTSLYEHSNDFGNGERDEECRTSTDALLDHLDRNARVKQFPFAFESNGLWNVSKTALGAVPAVILALLLNLLDAISYGIIIFPANDTIFPTSATSAGISMFLVSTIISQFIFSIGGSAFKGVIGSMMIEVMPFLHVMVEIVKSNMQGAPASHILSTILVSYAMSTVLTGLVFLLLGILKLGNVIQFFPRHTLIGCIGGIGLFLFLTGIEVTAGVPAVLNLNYLKLIFEPSAFKLWGTSLGVAILFKIVHSRLDHPLLVPVFYICIPAVFYLITFSAGISMDTLRAQKWLFSLPSKEDTPFWTFWTYYDFSIVNWNAVAATLPTQFALSFFGILHVPINVPALSVSTRQDVDLGWEIIGHGISNVVSGLCGSLQNYLVYSNSLLYIRSGGNSRVAGLMLTGATIFLWMKGVAIVGYVPVIVVGSLIFHLGIDLIKESMWDTWRVMKPLEYLTVLLIVFVMTALGFTEGILAGVLLACVFFVFTYSRRSVIRDTFTGLELRSTVHRFYRQQTFLDKVGNQIQIIKLQGFIFFGTLNQLEEAIKKQLEVSAQTRFIVIDFSLIYGIDYSASESFLRIRRMVSGRDIHLIFSGLCKVSADAEKSGLFDVEDDQDVTQSTFVHSFDSLNDSLEWCENYLLESFYTRVSRSVPRASITRLHGGKTLPFQTPRVQQVQSAASSVANGFPAIENAESFSPAASLLLQALPESSSKNVEVLLMIGKLFEKVSLLSDQIVYEKGQDPDGLYLVETGSLLLRTDSKLVETLLPGTMIGELELFSGHTRPCTLVAQSDATVWKLSSYSFELFCKEHPALALAFVTQIAITFDSVRFYNYIYHWSQLG